MIDASMDLGTEPSPDSSSSNDVLSAFLQRVEARVTAAAIGVEEASKANLEAIDARLARLEEGDGQLALLEAIDARLARLDAIEESLGRVTEDVLGALVQVTAHLEAVVTASSWAVLRGLEAAEDT
jgi:hypothetical protein